MKIILLLTVLAKMTFASNEYNFSSTSGGKSNRELYEALNIKEIVLSKKKSKGQYKNKPVVFLEATLQKSNAFFECIKTQYSLKKVNAFALYSCDFKVTKINLIEKNAVRKNNYLAVTTKGNYLEKFIFENTSVPSINENITNKNYKTKSFGNYRSKKISFDDKSYKPSYSFYIEN